MTTRKQRILVVDDEVPLNQLITTNLMIEGYEVEAAYCAAEALGRIGAFEPDLVLLDVMMPDMDGFEVLEQIRRTSDVPVIMLTARIRVPDRVRGLREGADDYVTKPFSLDELLARVDVQLRRRAAGRDEKPSEETLESGGLLLNITEHRVTAAGREIALQRLEFQLLAAFMRAEGRALTHDFLLTSVWEDGNGDLATLRVTVGKLRGKLREALGSDPIETVHGVGYRFTGK